MKNIKYSVISRGELVIEIDGKTLKVSGELTFSPSVFYADITSIKTWEPPFENDLISTEQKKEIIEIISSETKNQAMKIIFD